MQKLQRQCQDKAAHTEQAEHAKRERRERERERGREGETDRRLSGRGSQDSYVPRTEKPWHRCERQLKQARPRNLSEKEALTRPALGQSFLPEVRGIARKCPTEASIPQSIEEGGKDGDIYVLRSEYYIELVPRGPHT